MGQGMYISPQPHLYLGVDQLILCPIICYELMMPPWESFVLSYTVVDTETPCIVVFSHFFSMASFF